VFYLVHCDFPCFCSALTGWGIYSALLLVNKLLIFRLILSRPTLLFAFFCFVVFFGWLFWFFVVVGNFLFSSLLCFFFFYYQVYRVAFFGIGFFVFGFFFSCESRQEGRSYFLRVSVPVQIRGLPHQPTKRQTAPHCLLKFFV